MPTQSKELTITPEAEKIIREGVYSVPHEQNESFVKLICLVLVDPVLLKAQGLHTTEELNQAVAEAKALPSNDAEQQCENLPVIDTGVGYYFCPACKGSWTPEQFKAIEFKAALPSETNTLESADTILSRYEYDVHYYGGGRMDILKAMEEYANQFKAQQQVDPVKEDKCPECEKILPKSGGYCSFCKAII